MDEEPGIHDPIHLRHDHTEKAGAQMDAATDVAAASVAFNNASLPPDMPDWLKTVIRAKADAIIQTIHDEEIRVSDIRQRDEESRDGLVNLAQAMAEQREREWDQSQISIGHVAMSGQEWDDAYELLSDPTMRDRLIHKVMQSRGWSQPRAEKAADDALTLAQIAQKKKDGTITAADEAKADDITRRNPDAAVMAKEASHLYQEQGLESGIDQSASAQSRLSGDIAVAAQAQMQAVHDTTLQEDADSVFLSAPALSSHFDAARKEALASQVEETKVKPMPPRPFAAVDIGGPY